MKEEETIEKRLALEKTLRENPAVVALGVGDLLFKDDGSVEIPLPVKKEHTNIHGIVHGGIFVTLLDTAMGYACYYSAGRPCVTLNIGTSFIANCQPGCVVIARGRLLHAGHKVMVTEGEVVDANGRILAKGQGTFFALPDESQS